jgi:hypothetical protein
MIHDQFGQGPLDQALLTLTQQSELRQKADEERLNSLVASVSDYMNSHEFDKTKRLLSLLSERGDSRGNDLRFAQYNDMNDSGFDYIMTEHGFQSIPFGYSPSYATPSVMTAEEVVRAVCNDGMRPYRDVKNGEELVALFKAEINKRAEAIVEQVLDEK